MRTRLNIVLAGLFLFAPDASWAGSILDKPNLMQAKANRTVSKTLSRKPNRVRRSKRVQRIRSRKRVRVRRQSSSKISLGVELGAIGRGTNGANAEVLGLDLTYGGRAFIRFPFLTRRILLKPSLGYFTSSDSIGSISINQQRYQLGLATQLALSRSSGWQWHLAFVQKLEYLLSPVSILGESQETPGSFRYQLGPGVGFSVPLGKTTRLVSDAEVTFPLAAPVRGFLGATVGFQMRL